MPDTTDPKIAALHDNTRPLHTGAELLARLSGLPPHLRPGQTER
jgi:hypothetical protein